MTDYFYPYDPDYDDSAAYAKYGEPEGLSLEDWRRENTHTLMKMVSEMIEKTRPGVGVRDFSQRHLAQ